MDDITRREFVKAAAAGAATLSLASGIASARPDPGAAAGAGATSIRKAVKYGMVHGDAPMLEKFRLLARLGYDGVELDSPNGFDRDEVLEARDRSGLPIHGVVDSVHWNRPLSHAEESVRDEGRRALETAIEDAAAYGADSVLLVPAIVDEHTPYDAAYARSQAEIRRVIPLAEERGIRILFENVWNHFLLSPLEAARYVDELESDAVGWYFDVGNIVNYGWPEQWIRILGRRVGKLDIKEFSRSRRNDEGLWKGFGVHLLEGDCGWDRVMVALRDIGFSGWATAEVGGGDEARLRDIAERMDRIFAL